MILPWLELVYLGLALAGFAAVARFRPSDEHSEEEIERLDRQVALAPRLGRPMRHAMDLMTRRRAFPWLTVAALGCVGLGGWLRLG